MVMDLDLGGEALCLLTDRISVHAESSGSVCSTTIPDMCNCATGPVLPGTVANPHADSPRTCMCCNIFGIWNEDT